MKLHFLGANRQVTGSRYVIDVPGARLMIDCGLFQEREFQHRNWEESPIEPASINLLLLTHAHLDHCGRIPKLVKEGYTGVIYATPPTLELARLVLEDSAEIQQEDAAYKRKRHQREGRTGPHPEVPLYTVDDAHAAFRQLRPVEFEKPLKINDHVTAVYHDSGHILGAAMIELIINHNGDTRRVLFTGDLGQCERVMTTSPAKIEHADYIILESTYGNRVHKELDEHGHGVEIAFAEIINDTFQRGGNVVIPTFAIDRAQSLMYYISRLVREEKIPSTMVFLDSPMAIDATDIFKRYHFYLDKETQELLNNREHPFAFAGLHFTRTGAQSRAINNIKGSCIILAGSGMCTGGRIKHHLRQNIGRAESTILFVGYQADGTLGRHIIDGAKQVRIHGREYDVNARIAHLNGLSAHGDRDDLVRWLSQLKKPPSRLFLTHGEESAALSLQETLTGKFGWTVDVPNYGDTVNLT